MSKLSLHIITNMAPHYRASLWLHMLRSPDVEVHFYYDPSKQGSIRQIHRSAGEWRSFDSQVHPIRNIYFRKVLVWQIGVVKTMLRTSGSVIVFLGQSTVVSTWLAARLARLRGNRILFWGHGWYGREKGMVRQWRKWFNRLPDAHMVYGQWAKDQMIGLGLDPASIHVIYNSMDTDRQRSLRVAGIDDEFYRASGKFKFPELPVLLFIGRLTAQKRLDLLIQATIALNKVTPRVNLVIIGDGPMRSELEWLAGPIREQVWFYGPSYEESENARLIANASLCVSPGNIGLTAIHALGYGTPVCTHGDMRYQGPEAEAILARETGIFFQRGDLQDLAHCIDQWLSIPRSRAEIRMACYKEVDTRWNVEHQWDTIRTACMSEHP